MNPARAEYRASRPLALPLLILIFLRGGGISKKEWAAKARGGFLLGKRKGVIQMQYKVEPRHTKFFKEWRGANPICVCPTLPCAHIIPAVLGKIIKRWG
ncbi:TPA: hypothetical protein DEP94_03390 [Candidatus Nomurabacteria bacterium]|nr:hypothetical protein [Candidatus Nomurabacteria bacterium]